MEKEISDNPVELDAKDLSEHWANLDQAYRYMQKAYKTLTYEAGRLKDETGFEIFGKKAPQNLDKLANDLMEIGSRLREFAQKEKRIWPENPERPESLRH